LLRYIACLIFEQAVFFLGFALITELIAGAALATGPKCITAIAAPISGRIFVVINANGNKPSANE
jgi:hypothetical protein